MRRAGGGDRAPYGATADKFIVRDSTTLERNAAAHGQIRELGLTRTKKRSMFLAAAGGRGTPPTLSERCNLATQRLDDFHNAAHGRRRERRATLEAFGLHRIHDASCRELSKRLRQRDGFGEAKAM
jgi:hypothetical protein